MLSVLPTGMQSHGMTFVHAAVAGRAPIKNNKEISSACEALCSRIGKTQTPVDMASRGIVSFFPGLFPGF